MALVRILVDGQGLLQNWAEVAVDKPRTSTYARRELINQLTSYFDAAGVPLTVIFDATTPDQDQFISTPDVEVLFGKGNQTAVQALERSAARYLSSGSVLIVTDSPLRDTASPQRQVQSTSDFARTANSALADLAQNISRYNQESQTRFNRTV